MLLLQADFWLCSDADEGGASIPPFPAPLAITHPSPEEQALSGPACWLWDFLRRSGRRGLLLPLEGDVDSSLTAAIVVRMCRLVVQAVATGDEQVRARPHCPRTGGYGWERAGAGGSERAGAGGRERAGAGGGLYREIGETSTLLPVARE